MRALIVAASAFAACASAAAQETAVEDEHLTAQGQVQIVRRDGFVISNDACGASQYAHVIGEPYTKLHQAALPADANFVASKGLTTLEFEPGALNVVLSDQGRIIAIGCF
jgi:hypothetical protein